MRTYRVYYYYEHWDECHDCEWECQATKISEALLMFEQTDIVYKRVYRIDELPYVHQ